nr:hypothetical protein Itr_chr07CG07680 [Ipomoea trifida]GMD14432.1 hypothetical protein Iba_chr07bCG6340 [Ipomoea batatas]
MWSRPGNNTRSTSHVYYAPLLHGFHHTSSVFRSQKRTGDINTKDVDEICYVAVKNVGYVGSHDACIVDHYIKPSMSRDCFVDSILDIWFACDITMNKGSVTRTQIFADRLGLIISDVGY